MTTPSPRLSLSPPALAALLLLLIGTAGGQRYNVKDEIAPLVERRRAQLHRAADACVSSLGTSLGEEFLSCVMRTLEAAQRRQPAETQEGKEAVDDDAETQEGKEADADDDNAHIWRRLLKGGERLMAMLMPKSTEPKTDDDVVVDAKLVVDDDPFPVPSYDLHPLSVSRVIDASDDAQHGLLLMDLLRNYTCGRAEDGGSRPVDATSWTYDERAVMDQIDEERTCPALLSDASDDFFFVPGFLPGHEPDIDHGKGMTVEEAKTHCDSLPNCAGFCFPVPPDGGNVPEFVSFKGKATRGKVTHNEGWQSYVRRQIPARCLPDTDGESTEEEEEEEEVPEVPYAPPQEYAVEIIRREPLVAVIPNFATDEECDVLIQAGGSDESMGRAHERSGPSSYRRSYSSNIDVDYDDRADPVTRFSEKMFAFVRNVTGYDVHGPGQEPINAVLYKDVGDEYRPHCDGPCNGGSYHKGKRIATSIVYCEIPRVETEGGTKPGGGQTSFTRSGLMVAPRKGDLLLFAYKYENGTMDNGFTEHSGCPILGGRKWIATQWYREGVDYDNPWVRGT